MSEKTTTTAASAIPQFPGIDAFKKMYEDGGTRMSQMFDEAGKAHTKWIEYGNTQIDEMSDLLKTQFNYMNDLAATWRKLSVETMKKSMDVFGQK